MKQYVIRSNERWGAAGGPRFLVLSGGSVRGVSDTPASASKWLLPADAAIAFADASSGEIRHAWDLCEYDAETGEAFAVRPMSEVIGEGVASHG